MSARKLLDDLAHALRVFVPSDDDAWVELWHRHVPMQMRDPETRLWAGLPCADRPPTTWRLTSREERGRAVHELLWRPDDTTPEAQWPVVEVDARGETTIVAASAEAWIDAMLYTGGLLGGGTEEDLEGAADDASPEARALSNDLLDELDREPADVLELAEGWEEAVDRWSDAWAEAVEAVD